MEVCPQCKEKKEKEIEKRQRIRALQKEKEVDSESERNKKNRQILVKKNKHRKNDIFSKSCDFHKKPVILFSCFLAKHKLNVFHQQLQTYLLFFLSNKKFSYKSFFGQI